MDILDRSLTALGCNMQVSAVFVLFCDVVICCPLTLSTSRGATFMPMLNYIAAVLLICLYAAVLLICWISLGYGAATFILFDADLFVNTRPSVRF